MRPTQHDDTAATKTHSNPKQKTRRRKKLSALLEIAAVSVRTQVCYLGPLENSARSSKKGATLLQSQQNHYLLQKADG